MHPNHDVGSRRKKTCFLRIEYILQDLKRFRRLIAPRRNIKTGVECRPLHTKIQGTKAILLS
jgi:hypothetical protein